MKLDLIRAFISKFLSPNQGQPQKYVAQIEELSKNLDPKTVPICLPLIWEFHDYRCSHFSSQKF